MTENITITLSITRADLKRLCAIDAADTSSDSDLDAWPAAFCGSRRGRRERRMLSMPMTDAFHANESVGLLRPALALYLDGAQTDPPIASDVFSRDGRLWTVRKTFFFRWGDTPLVILALCD